jgi:hypothetical protein
VAMDPRGVYLYIATQYFGPNAPSQAFGYTIDPTTGSLTPIPGTPFQLSMNSGSFAFHPSGNFIYMSNTAGTSIDAYAIDRSTGKISPVSGGSLSTCVNPSQLSFAPDGTHAYVTCSMDTNHDAHSASLASYAVSPSGQLSAIGSAATDDAPPLPLVDPSGQFVYVPALSDYIESFKIGSDGVATATQRFGARSQVGSMLVLGGPSPVRYASLNAYVTTTGDNQIANYPLRTDGSWGTVAQSFVTQVFPFSLTLITEGADLFFTTRSVQPDTQHYSVDPNTGALSHGFFVGSNAAVSAGVIADQSGLYFFQSDSGNGSVDNYFNFNGFWILQLSISSQPGAGPMALDPTSRFLFVANQGGEQHLRLPVFRHLLTPDRNEWVVDRALHRWLPLSAGCHSTGTRRQSDR